MEQSIILNSLKAYNIGIVGFHVQLDTIQVISETIFQDNPRLMQKNGLPLQSLGWY